MTRVASLPFDLMDYSEVNQILKIILGGCFMTSGATLRLTFEAIFDDEDFMTLCVLLGK